ncbi:MAG: NADH-quinone oxidoreductase subunit C [Chloroflexota bacterium]|nr:NADH-quinone oxidoreductase subunit C [Chloroflexota bacterium]MDE2969349.1 NADH-quinone oxidoreductase subunit C [Chloroflexota bacterium]
MTRALNATDVAGRLEGAAEAVSADGNELRVAPESLVDVCRRLKEEPEFAMDFLSSITAVDYMDSFEVVYHLTSLTHNHSLVLKTTLRGRDGVEAPSLTGVWQAADLQEREVWDLMGVRFTGHPNLKRVLTWEGFPGHPLRKDHLGG